VSALGLAGAPDAALWERAAKDGFVLVSKDEDFHRLSVLRGAPPKFVWVRLGNCSVADLMRLFRVRHPDLERFATHEEATFLALG
jgi:predicted nuclease of predicted toxin-antitoxin system